MIQTSFSKTNESNNCILDNNFKEINNIKNLNSISIDIPNTKKWAKNIFVILRNNGWIPNKLKKNHSANIDFFFTNGLVCSFKAKIKFHGDNPDHIVLLDNFHFLTSLNVKLINSNIQNITEFKLFLPSTRGKEDDEIFATNLLREIGFFAPLTKKINVSLNGINQEYLFQEKIGKEFIESYGFTEGPIIEGDQRFLHLGQSFLQLSRVVNKNWVNKNWRNAYISLDAVSRVNELYLKFYKSKKRIVTTNDYFLEIINLLERDNYKSNNYKKNLFYDRFVYSIGGKHSLAPYNRTFYYNYLENNFYPIYYDGMVSFPKFSINKSKEKTKLSNSNILLNNLLNLNLDLLKIKNSNAGIVSENFKDLKIVQKNIIDNFLLEIKDFKVQNLKKENFSNYYQGFPNKKIKLIFFNKKPNNFLICSINIANCVQKELSLSDISEVVSQRYNENKDFKYIFVSSDFQKYKNNQLTDYKTNWKKININNNLYAKINNNIDIKVNLKNKKIFLKQKRKNGRVIFFSEDKIKDWTFYFESENKIYQDNLLISKDDLDGCITFYNSDFQNVKFFIKRGFCEDSINFVKSKGLIDKIFVQDAFQDGIDMDFSNIFVNNVYVKNSGNDCIDFSFGNYQVNNFKLINCSDNGVSLGEKSNLISESINIKTSKVGLAVKDSSKAIVDYLNSNDNDLCFSIYRKKKEFLGAELFIKNLNCSNNLYNVELGSKFYLENGI